MPRYLIIAGIALIAIGTILHFAPWLFNWFGRLPGDIRHETENSKVFFPITTTIVVSIILTVLLNLLNLFKR